MGPQIMQYNPQAFSTFFNIQTIANENRLCAEGNEKLKRVLAAVSLFYNCEATRDLNNLEKVNFILSVPKIPKIVLLHYSIFWMQIRIHGS